MEIVYSITCASESGTQAILEIEEGHGSLGDIVPVLYIKEPRWPIRSKVLSGRTMIHGNIRWTGEVLNFEVNPEAEVVYKNPNYDDKVIVRYVRKEKHPVRFDFGCSR